MRLLRYSKNKTSNSEIPAINTRISKHKLDFNKVDNPSINSTLIRLIDGRVGTDQLTQTSEREKKVRKGTDKHSLFPSLLCVPCCRTVCINKRD